MRLASSRGLVLGERCLVSEATSQRSRRVAWKLGLCDVGVGAPFGQELAVAPALDDAAAVDHADPHRPARLSRDGGR